MPLCTSPGGGTGSVSGLPAALPGRGWNPEDSSLDGRRVHRPLPPDAVLARGVPDGNKGTVRLPLPLTSVPLPLRGGPTVFGFWSFGAVR